MDNSHRIGFGSFSTLGDTNSINRVNTKVLRLIDDLVPRLNGSQLHSFGHFNAACGFCLAMVGVKTFDSNGWMRTGGYGSIFFPFMYGRQIDCKTRRYSRIHKDELEPLKLNTGHRCPFCESFDKLSEESGRWLRIMHNLTVMTELATYNYEPQWHILKDHSRQYYQILKDFQYRPNIEEAICPEYIY